MEQEQYADTVYRLLAGRLRVLLEKSGLDWDGLQEIRLRAKRPLLLKYRGAEYALTEAGELTGDIKRACTVTQKEVDETLEYVSGYSLYAFTEELKQGFLTVPGGHRVGLAGKTVTENDCITCLRYISFVNIRLAHQVRGCADAVLPYLFADGRLCSTLIVSPPGCGKTTLLRDIIRQLSDGSPKFAGMTVGVVDERSEIAGCYLGIPQNDVGIRTDVLDCCPKSQGMMMLLRSMAPQVIAVDEIGSCRDWEALEYVRSCGCRLLATMHGDSAEDARGMFERFIVLGGSPAGCVKAVTDGQGALLYGEDGGNTCSFQ